MIRGTYISILVGTVAPFENEYAGRRCSVLDVVHAMLCDLLRMTWAGSDGRW